MEFINHEIDIQDKDSEMNDEKEQKIFINEIITTLRKEDEIPLDKIAVLIELFQNKEKNNSVKLFLDSILDKKRNLSKFSNLKNLQHLSNIISFISLNEDSIFEGKFEINFKKLCRIGKKV